VIRHMARRVMANGAPLVFYVHPREIDTQHPRIPMPGWRHFKCYVNLRTTESKIRQIIRDFPVTTCRDFIFGSVSEWPDTKSVLSTMVTAELFANRGA
jgi:Domain of unknown function (DUF3473)